ncbi:ras GEF [Stereum hirsutum FP-91666 SS1]|uniref:ras GEF n=1 Tax=Stereum hirsutum (strain FP-91666) TaxID=721885 RepID=UPI0004449E67|nr:ras GEF [Stereum hirsutum FP-91666 SS1]EIM84381.1 ras GEF [Stereum hirsutum FP-91666 SS1]
MSPSSQSSSSQSLSSTASSSPVLTSPGLQESPSHLRLPIPTPTSNRSQSSFAFMELSGEEDAGEFGDLPPEMAAADISLAPDGSFVETSSATVAYDLKKRYDRYLGVGMEIRSPYAITAFVNQHGKQMFRVGNREMSAPAASGQEAEQRTTMQLERNSNISTTNTNHNTHNIHNSTNSSNNSNSAQPQTPKPQKSPASSRSDGRQKRRSRMSMQALFAPSVFPPARGDSGFPPMSSTSFSSTKTTSSSSQHSQTPAHVQAGTAPRMVVPPNANAHHHHHAHANANGNGNGIQSPPTRKLRKTRSNPQLPAPPAAESSASGSAAPQPPTPAARVHSHSVTAADMPRLPSVAVAPDSRESTLMAATEVVKQPRGDIFSDVMEWNAPPSPFHNSSESPSPSTSYEDDESDGGGALLPLIVMQPFGPGVTFDSPSRKSDSLLISPPVLREMQSFESGLTAKADPDSRIGRSSLLSPLKPLSTTQSQTIEETPPSPDLVEPEGAASPSPPPSPLPPPRPQTLSPPRAADPSYLPTVQTQIHTRYPTEVFDVLQTYRGLPLLDRLFADSTETTVIKMSANADETAAPRDDPRFVIWGEVYPDPEDHLSVSQESQTNLSSSRSGVSRRKSTTKGNKESTLSIDGTQPKVRVHSPLGPQKVLVAATIERWIAQLTSDLNYDELLIFFLTYRTYISAVDLCHLLICRFHWALGQPSSSSKQDEMVRRIVRVRTFVALRYWLLTFFAIDFMPNRDLRLLLASWLNSLKRDPILLKHSDATSTVRKLISVVRECREVHARRERPSTSGPRPSAASLPSAPPTTAQIFGPLFGGDALPRQPSNESDIDLDFFADETSTSSMGNGAFDAAVNPDMLNGGPMNKTASASLAVMQQPLNRAILHHAPTASANMAVMPTSATLPVHTNVLSRALVRTFGRLGRWKRQLNSRSSVPTPMGPCADVSAFDLELNATGDLLTVRGGMEQYLKMFDLNRPSTSTAVADPSAIGSAYGQPSTAPSAAEAEPAEEVIAVETEGDAEADADAQSLADVPEASDESAGTYAGGAATPSIASSDIQVSLRPVNHSRHSSGSSGSSDYGEPIARSSHSIPPSPAASVNPSLAARPSPSARQPPPSWQMDVVSIDDLDLSDSASDKSTPALPPGLQKTPRRLPLRRDFEFVDRNRDSVSSMGLASHESMISPASSTTSSMSGGGLGSTIQQWQMNALVDSLSDDDEVGDVEDALKRLEGQMSPQKQKKKESKVDNWIRAIRGRMDAGDYTDEAPRFSAEFSDDVNEPYPYDHHDLNGGASSSSNVGGGEPSNLRVRSSVQSEVSLLAPGHEGSEDVTPLATQTSHSIPTTAVSTPGSEARPHVEDVVPIEILQSRVLSLSPTHSPEATPMSPPVLTPPISKFGSAQIPQYHRSWVHAHSAGELAQHFTMIDRELFLGVKFEELVSAEWVGLIDEANILDWGQFLKDRARWKAEGRGGYKTSALVATRGRFNLIANFVLSEIVLTPPADRPALVGKFIRIAWKCYNVNNYSTLVAIIAGLRSEWVTKVMRTSWHRVNVYNRRMFKDLTAFTDSTDDFVHIRNTVAAMSDDAKATVSEDPVAPAKNHTHRHRATSDLKPAKPQSCVPFIGIYLSPLHRFSQLPDLIDPTAPNEASGVDQYGNLIHPAHPDVFSTLAPLPPSMQLEPLINVHKQRLIAGSIKALVAGQHLASRVQFPIDRKLFQKCLKLRGLDQDTLQRAYQMYPH